MATIRLAKLRIMSVFTYDTEHRLDYIDDTYVVCYVV